MPFVEIAGDQLYFEEAGSGRPLFLLHGNAGSAGVWKKVIPRLADCYRVIAHDRRGFGSSTKREDGDVSPRGYATELVRLLDALNIERAHIAGLSFGGMVAQCFALDFPDRLDGLVLVGTTADRTGRNVEETLAEHERNGWPSAARRLASGWFRADADPADIDEAHAIALKTTLQMYARTVKALGGFDIRLEIENIRAPTLVVIGEDDMTLPMPFSEFLKHKIPGAGLSVISNCAHLVPVEQPDAFCDAVMPFLAIRNADDSHRRPV